MTLRLATPEDTETVVKLARLFHQASPYNHEDFDTEKVRALASEILGIDKSTLWRKIKRYQIE